MEAQCSWRIKPKHESREQGAWQAQEESLAGELRAKGGWQKKARSDRD